MEQEHTDHLMSILEKDYIISSDKKGESYLGPNLD